MVGILALVLRYLRTRKAIVGADNNQWCPNSMEQVYLEKARVDKACSPMQQTQDLDLFPALFDPTFSSFRPFTSGFLAARAEFERAGKAAVRMDTTSVDELLARELDIPPHAKASLDPRKDCLRRCSYPQTQISERSLFRDDADVDHTEHLQDEHDLALIWRRRIMTFEGKP